MENRVSRNEQQYSLDDNVPRQEYINGWIPLDFSFQFSNGRQLVAQESEIEWQEVENQFRDEDCQIPYEWPKRTPLIRIDDTNGNTVFDFNTLLPKGFSFVIPKSFDTGDLLRSSFEQGWVENDEGKRIFIGDWRKPQDLIALMHELGHANISDDPRKDHGKIDQIFETKQTGEKWYQLETQRKNMVKDKGTEETVSSIIKAKAFSERTSWAWGLKTLRILGDKMGVDIINELGLTRLQLSKLMEDALRSHKNKLAQDLSLQSIDKEEEEIVNALVKSLAKEFKIPD